MSPTRRAPSHPRTGEQGVALPIFALFLIVLLGAAALSIDVGNAYLHKRRLQAAVDLAVLSGSQKLPNTGTAGTEAKAFAARNWAATDSSAVATTAFSGCQVAGCENPDKITLEATAKVPTAFARVLGVPEFTVKARAAACGPCETSTREFDVMVVLDRSYSMCTDGKGVDNGCYDLNQAKEGIRSLLGFFDPAHDRIGLAALSSGDSRAPFDHVGPAAPCDTAGHSYSGTKRFLGSLGDFMDGTPADHDSWVLSPLSSSFKKPDGSIDPASPIVSTLNCLQSKAWTPVAPAIQEATKELTTRGRSGPDVDKIIVFLGDGGANVQPMQRDSQGRATTVRSWYTPSPGNDQRPCHDAVGQAAIAKAAGIHMYTIGYDLDASSAQICSTDNLPGDPAHVEAGINARSTMLQMASRPADFHERVGAGDLTQIFRDIGRQIVKGGSRLVE